MILKTVTIERRQTITDDAESDWLKKPRATFLERNILSKEIKIVRTNGKISMYVGANCSDPVAFP